MNEIRIYVASLSDYNNGRLEGKWLDLSDYSDASELMEAIQEMLDELTEKYKSVDGEVREEWAVHDYEGIPSTLASEYMGEQDFQQLYDIAIVADDRDIPLQVLVERAGDTGSDDYHALADSLMLVVDGNNENDIVFDYEDQIGQLGFDFWSNHIFIDDVTERVMYGEDVDRFRDDILSENPDIDEDEAERQAEEMADEEAERREDLTTYLEDMGYGDEIPNWVSKDYEGAWKRSLSYDLDVIHHDGEMYVFSNNYSLGGTILSGMIGAYIGYKIGRAKPQKKGFETEKKIGRKIKGAFSKKKMARGGSVEKLADLMSYLDYYWDDPRKKSLEKSFFGKNIDVKVNLITEGEFELAIADELEKIKMLSKKVDFDEVRGEIDYGKTENNTDLEFYKNGKLVMTLKGDYNSDNESLDTIIDLDGETTELNYHPADGFGGVNLSTLKKNINDAFRELGIYSAVVSIEGYEEYAEDVKGLENAKELIQDIKGNTKFQVLKGRSVGIGKRVDDSRVIEEFAKGGSTSKSDLDILIDEINEKSGGRFYLGGAYGNYELWGKDKDGGDHRIEVGSRKDIREALIKNRYNSKFTEYAKGGEVDGKKYFTMYRDEEGSVKTEFDNYSDALADYNEFASDDANIALYEVINGQNNLLKENQSSADIEYVELSNGDIVVTLEKIDGKWEEGEVLDGEIPYGWGGKRYMGYLKPKDLAQWLNKDYGGYFEIVDQYAKGGEVDGDLYFAIVRNPSDKNYWKLGWSTTDTSFRDSEGKEYDKLYFAGSKNAKKYYLDDINYLRDLEEFTATSLRENGINFLLARELFNGFRYYIINLDDKSIFTEGSNIDGIKEEIRRLTNGKNFYGKKGVNFGEGGGVEDFSEFDFQVGDKLDLGSKGIKYFKQYDGEKIIVVDSKSDLKTSKGTSTYPSSVKKVLNRKYAKGGGVGEKGKYIIVIPLKKYKDYEGALVNAKIKGFYMEFRTGFGAVHFVFKMKDKEPAIRILNELGIEPMTQFSRDKDGRTHFAEGGGIGFKALSAKVAKRYEGKSVAPKYQSQYGTTYSKSEAKEVGDKVAGKVYWNQQGRKMANGGGVSGLDDFVKREGIVRGNLFFIVDKNGKRLQDWSHSGDNILRFHKDWEGEDSLSYDDVVTESILKSNGVNPNNVNSVVVYDLSKGEEIFNGSQLSDTEWYDYVKFLKKNTYEGFAKGGGVGKFPIALKRNIDEINDLFVKVKSSDEVAGGYFGGTHYTYVKLEKPIEIKGNYVYIFGEKDRYNYSFEKRYNINKKGDEVDGLSALKYDLSNIKKAFKSVLKNQFAKGGGVEVNTEVILTENRSGGEKWRGVVKPSMLKSIEENQYRGGFKRYEIDIYDEVNREPSKEELKEANKFFEKIGGRYAQGGGISGLDDLLRG